MPGIMIACRRREEAAAVWDEKIQTMCSVVGSKELSMMTLTQVLGHDVLIMQMMGMDILQQSHRGLWARA